MSYNYIDGYCIIYYKDEYNLLAAQEKRSKCFLKGRDYQNLDIRPVYTDKGNLSHINISGNLDGLSKEDILAYAKVSKNNNTSNNVFEVVDELVPIKVSFNNDGFSLSNSEIQDYFD